MPNQYPITWCQKEQIPEAGSKCIKCGKGTLRESKFFKGVYCDNCKHSWRVSKYPPKSPPKSEQQFNKIKEYYINTYKKLLEIEGKIEKIEKKIGNTDSGWHDIKEFRGPSSSQTYGGQ